MTNVGAVNAVKLPFTKFALIFSLNNALESVIAVEPEAVFATLKRIYINTPVPVSAWLPAAATSILPPIILNAGAAHEEVIVPAVMTSSACSMLLLKLKENCVEKIFNAETSEMVIGRLNVSVCVREVLPAVSVRLLNVAELMANSSVESFNPRASCT